MTQARSFLASRDWAWCCHFTTHSLPVPSPDMFVFWRTEKTVSFMIFTLYQVFSLGEESGQIGIYGLRPITFESELPLDGSR